MFDIDEFTGFLEKGAGLAVIIMPTFFLIGFIIDLSSNLKVDTKEYNDIITALIASGILATFAILLYFISTKKDWYHEHLWS